MNVGRKTKSLRELNNYSQIFIAKELRISQSVYSYIEINVTNINVNKLGEIVQVIDVNFTQILNLNEENFKILYINNFMLIKILVTIL